MTESQLYLFHQIHKNLFLVSILLAIGNEGLSYSQDFVITILRALGLDDIYHLIKASPNPASVSFMLFIDPTLDDINLLKVSSTT